ncbi:MAG: thiamine biosynthesis protein ThiF [Planctomycetes bacterium GWF2_41_51]|nr:MAG: thiamine biosynthesis protein ThiF [Planctomycetes bacterium GWF2_41_51]HBG60712.1 thiamine biosynthesis protein ThiF [Candidatus Omnitrophota bacterium]
MSNDDRYSRQKGIVPAERISQCKATVIGVGAIGRQVALQLAAIGVPWLQLFDHDRVELTNIASQGYFEEDLNRFKADATADLCWHINSQLEIDPHTERFRRSIKTGNVVFCCVDSIATRQLIWESVKNRTSCFIDGRMAAEVLRVLTACDVKSREYYPTTLFTSEQAYTGSCTAKTTIYCANIAAGLMISQFTKYLRNLPVEADIQFNLLANEISVEQC